MWKPSVTPTDVLMHSQGPWTEHKYIKVVDGVYYYPNSYKNGHTISEIKGSGGEKDEKEKKDDKSSLTDEDIEKIANETIAGKHGNGNDRKEKFGSDYARIQNKVNEKLGVKKRHETEDSGKETSKKEEDKKDSTSKSETGKSSKSSKKGSKKSSGSSDATKTTENKSDSKSNSSATDIDKLAKDIIAGKYGNGKERKEKLGSDYAKAQNRANEMLNNNKRHKEIKHGGIWSPTVMSDDIYLCHHGRLGQRKGIQNGPPYPLGSGQLSSTEKKEGGWISKFAEGRREAKKIKKRQQALQKARNARVAKKKNEEERKRLIEKGTKDEILKNRSKLSTDEMNKALDRLKQEDVINQKIKELGDDYKRINQFENFANQAKRVTVGTQKFIDAYNTGAGIYNAVMTFKGNDKRLPKVNYQAGGDGGNKNNNNGGNNNSPNIMKAVINKANEMNKQDKKKK